jgi:phosphomannomutase
MIDYLALYTDFLRDHLTLVKPLKVVCDASNGPTGLVLEALKKKVAGLELILINETIDPEFSAHGPNPSAPGALDQLSKKVIEEKADLGAAFDADGDRAVFVDDKGQPVTPHALAYLLFKNAPAPYVADELLYQSLVHVGGFAKDAIIPSRVGAYFIKETMRVNNASRGAEISGHYYYHEFFGLDSGLFSLMQVATLVSRLGEINNATKASGAADANGQILAGGQTSSGGQTFSQYIALIPAHVLITENYRLGEMIAADSAPWQKIEANVAAAFSGDIVSKENRDGVTFDFGASWLNVRLSNTEPLVRVTIGAPTQVQGQQILNKLGGLFTEQV